MKNIIITVLVIIVFLGFLVWLAKPANQLSQVSAPSSSLVGPESNFDFGTISMAQGKVSHIFSVKNNSNRAINISRIYTSCMCTQANLILGNQKIGPFGMPGHGFNFAISQIIQPGQDFKVEAIFDPAAHGPAGVGSISRQIIIQTDSDVFTLGFSVLVTP